MRIKYYTDKLLIVLEKESRYYLDNEIDEKLFEFIYQRIDEKKIKRIEAENIEDMKAITIFINEIQFHLGIMDMYDDVNYYLDNLSEDISLTTIDGNCFEKRFVHSDFGKLWNIFEQFSIKGEISKDVNWYIE